MRILTGIAAAVLLLLGSASILLRTNQAPLPEIERDEVAVVAAAPAEPKALSTEEFRVLGADVMKAIPPKGSPLPILAAAREFERVEEAAKGDSTLVDEAMLLYHECSRSQLHADSVRALCIVNLRNIGRRYGKELPRLRVPPEIRQLADKIAH